MIRTFFGTACLVLILAACGPVVLQAQEEGGEEEYVVERLPYFGVGAGYVRMFAFPDYDPINDVSSRLGLGSFSGPMNLDVFGLTFTPGFIPNLRIGFYGGLGTTQISRQARLQDTTYTRTIYFTNVFGAIQADYAAIQVSSAFTIFAGVMLGYGRNTLGASQTSNAGANFFDVFSGPIFQGDTATNLTNFNRFARALSYHVLVYPTVNFEYTLTPNIMVRVGAGYNTSIRATPWSDEGGVELLDAPSISANGFAAQIGIFLGLFQH